MKKVISVLLSVVILFSLALSCSVSAVETTERFSINKINHTGALFSNNAVSIEKGDTYRTTISYPIKDRMGRLRVGVITANGRIIKPEPVDDYSVSVTIPDVDCDIYISVYTEDRDIEIVDGGTGYGMIVRNLKNVTSDTPNKIFSEKYGYEEFYTESGSFLWQETLTPVPGYEIKSVNAISQSATLYDYVDRNGVSHKGYGYSEENPKYSIEKHSDGSWTFSYVSYDSIYLEAVAEPIETEPTTPPKPTTPTVKKTTVNLQKASAKLYLKGSTKIKADVKNGVGKTTYKSSDKSIAKVDSNGKVTALKKGTAKITVTNNKVSKTFTVTVKKPFLNKTSLKIKKGAKFTLKVTGKVGKAEFLTSNKKIAAVNQKGKITAKKKGNATVTVKTNGIKLKCKVNVR